MSPFDTISAEALQQKLRSKEVPVVINTLTPEAYRAKRIPGSINIPTNHMDRMEEVVPDKGQPLVVYCADADCDASPKAANALVDLGYKQVTDFQEGLQGWTQAGYSFIGHETSDT
ncbi:MAG TPA: rhodanese-like domain-containing protein [Fodinibius sp.]|nr:rhodanese-like domain-containing protein [Fodinibius sp.]